MLGGHKAMEDGDVCDYMAMVYICITCTYRTYTKSRAWGVKDL